MRFTYCTTGGRLHHGQRPYEHDYALGRIRARLIRILAAGTRIACYTAGDAWTMFTDVLFCFQVFYRYFNIF